MRSFWVDPYLWIHLVGIAAVPIFLEFCLLGLSIGEPLFPVWFELLFVGAIGILPILWMQWQRPFSIFSLLVLALKPTQLTEDQRRILSLFKSFTNRVLAVLVAVGMAWILWQLYQLTPAVSPSLFPNIARGTALLIAALAFFGANLFLQIPVSVLGVLWASNSQFAATAPYPIEQIPQGFTIPGIRVGAIVPPLFSAPVKAKVSATPPSTDAPSTAPSPTAPPAPPPIAVPDQPPPVAEPVAFDEVDLEEDEFEDELESPVGVENPIAVDIAVDVAADTAAASDERVDSDAENLEAENLKAENLEAEPTAESDQTVEGLDEVATSTDVVVESEVDMPADPVMPDLAIPDPSSPVSLLRESEPLRLTETADITEEIPIAETVVERLTNPDGSQEDAMITGAFVPEVDPEVDPEPEQNLVESDRASDSPEDSATSRNDDMAESINPPPDIIEDATLSEMVESQDENVTD